MAKKARQRQKQVGRQAGRWWIPDTSSSVITVLNFHQSQKGSVVRPGPIEGESMFSSSATYLVGHPFRPSMPPSRYFHDYRRPSRHLLPSFISPPSECTHHQSINQPTNQESSGRASGNEQSIRKNNNKSNHHRVNTKTGAANRGPHLLCCCCCSLDCWGYWCWLVGCRVR